MKPHVVIFILQFAGPSSLKKSLYVKIHILIKMILSMVFASVSSEVFITFLRDSRFGKNSWMRFDSRVHTSRAVPAAAGALAEFSIIPDCSTPQAVT